MIRPKVFNIFFAALAACVLCVSTAFAQATLKPIESDPLPATVKQGQKTSFRLTFRKTTGGRIKSAVMSVSTPDGQDAKVNGTIVGDDTANGVDIKWDAKFDAPGTYTPRFIVTDGEGDTTTYPAPEQEPYRFTVDNLMINVGIFAGTLLVGLVFLPWLVYTLSRSMNQRGDPSGAARSGLLIGILACGAVFCWRFYSFLGPLAIAIGVIGALAGLVLVLTNKRR